MGTLATLAFLGCCALAILVYVLFKRVDELKRDIAWYRKYVHDLARWAGQLHQYVTALGAAAPKAEVEAVQKPSPEPAPVARPPEPAKPPEPEKPREPVPERAPVAVPPVVIVPLPKPEIGVTHAPPARPTPPRPTPPLPRPVERPHVPVTPPAPVTWAAPAPLKAEATAPHPAASVGEARTPPPSVPPPHTPVAHAETPPHRPKADLELTIGTRWLSKIGMVAVLAALVFLIWYLYDQGIIVITREMVIGAGILLGLALMVGAEFAHRRGYEPQSEALTGGGAATLYLTLWVALHLWGIFAETITFVAMALVTAGAAVQSLRHDSQTIAVLAWVAGYLVPLFIGERAGGDSGGGGAYGLFIYLTLLSVGVFVVAQRQAWPAFTGLALMAAHASAAYIFRVSDGSLLWTLAYLLIITGGMMWVAVTQKEKAGVSYCATGAIAGYLITGVAMLVGGQGEQQLYAPYLYLLVLSGVIMVLSRACDWPSLRWLSVVGSVMGLLLLYHAGALPLGNWLLLYAALYVAGSLVASGGREGSTEPLAVTSVLSAYGAAALFVCSPSALSISPEALFGYLAALAGGVLYVGVRRDWDWLPCIGSAAAFLATGLLYQQAPHGGLAVYPLVYLVALSIAVISIATWLDDDWLAGIGIGGAFAALPLTGAFGSDQPAMLVPTYLALAAVATLAVIERRKWFGQEWIALGGVWLLYPLWRLFGERVDPMPAQLAYTAAYVLIFLVASWVRHGVRGDVATADSLIFMVLNALAFFGIGWWDVSRLPAEWYAPGSLALALFAIYLGAGVAAVKRCPGDALFGPTLIGLSISFFTVAVPLVVHGYHMTVVWALEATVLMALGFHFRSFNLRVGSLVVMTIALLRTIGLDNLVEREGYQVILNSRALGNGAVIAALYLCSYLYARLRERVEAGEHWLVSGLTGVATVLLWWVVSAEAWCYVGWQLGYGPDSEQLALSGAWVLFAAVLAQIGMARNLGALRWSALGLLAVTVLKVFAIDPALQQTDYMLVINSHALPLIAVAALVYQLAYWHSRRADGDGREIAGVLCGAATVLLLWIVSAETWYYTGWQRNLALAAQHFALSGAWVVFAAALIQVGLLRRVAVLRWSGVGLLAMTAIKVFAVDPPLTSDTYTLVANSHSLPLLSIVGLLAELVYWHYRRADDEAPVLGICGSLLLFWVCCSETWMYLGWVAQAGRAMQQLGLSMVWLIFGMAALSIGMVRQNAALRWTGLLLFTCTLGKVFLVDPRLTPESYLPIANAHTFPLIVIAGMLFGLSAWYIRVRDELGESEKGLAAILPVVSSVLLWWVLTSEAWRFTGWFLEESRTAQQYALSAVWTFYAAALVAAGLLRQRAVYRWTALTLFAVTIIKVFFLDLASQPLPLRVLAFMGLGAALIAVSFGYQRLVRTQEREA